MSTESLTTLLQGAILFLGIPVALAILLLIPDVPAPDTLGDEDPDTLIPPRTP